MLLMKQILNHSRPAIAGALNRGAVFRLLLLIILSTFATQCTDKHKVVKAISDENCTTDEEFFKRKVWGPVIQGKGCHGCHGQNGIASIQGVDWVLSKDSPETDFRVLKTVAKRKLDGESILLKKPVSPASGATITHDGGNLFPDSGADYDDLKEFVNRAENPTQCNKRPVAYDVLYGVQEYDYARTLRRAKIALTGEIPTAGEETLVIEKGRTGLVEALDLIMQRDVFYDRLREIMNDIFHTDKYVYDPSLGRYVDAYRVLDEDIYPARDWFRTFPASSYDTSVTSTTGDPDVRLSECYPSRNITKPEDEVDKLGCLRRKLEANTNKAIAREPLELIVHTVKNELPFTNIVTADYMMVNAYSARSYGLTNQQGVSWFKDSDKLEDHSYDHFVPAKLYQREVVREEPRSSQVTIKTNKIQVPLAGMLTSPLFLERYPGAIGNVNRHRSNIAFNFFLDTDILTLAQQLDAFGDGHVNPTYTDPNCAVCHAVMDPVAGLFKNYHWDKNYYQLESWYHDEDWYRTSESTKMRKPGLSESEVLPPEYNRNPLQWFGAKIARDERFADSMVKRMFKALTGENPMGQPSDNDRPPGITDDEWGTRYTRLEQAYQLQQNDLRHFRETFINSNYNLKTLLKEIILSPYFRAKNARSEVQDDVRIANVGISSLLTPEQLQRKLESVTGYAWERYDGPYLLREYRFLYGGIDSDDITTRIDDTSGIMAGIQGRMAFDVACEAVAQDFSYTTHSRRKLFPLVEPGYVPEVDGVRMPQAIAKIKKNIQYLYKRFTGTYYQIDDPEIDRAYRLFYLTFKEGVNPPAADTTYSETASKWPDGRVNTSNQNRYEQDAALKCTVSFSGNIVPDGRREIESDPNYTIRAWQAVVAYIMLDYRFIYQ